MRLNLFFVLSDLAHMGFKGSPAQEPSVARCRYATVVPAVPSAPRSDVFYVVRGENLPSRPHSVGSASIVCVGKPPIKWMETGVLVYTEADVTEIDVVNALAELFDKYQTWEDDLSSAMSQGMPFEKLGAYSTEVMGNPIIAQSPTYDVFFYALPTTAPTLQLYDDYYREVYLSHVGEDGIAVPKRPATMFNQESNFAQLEGSVEPVVFRANAWHELSESGLSFRSLMLNCYLEGEPVARLIVDEVARPFQAKDHVLIKTLGEYFKRGFFAQGGVMHERHTRFGRVCEQLAMGQNVSAEKIDGVLSKLEWEASDGFFCAVLRERKLAHSFSTAVRIALTITAHDPALRYHFFNGRCLIVCNIRVSGVPRAETMARIEGELAGTGTIASFSSSFSEFSLLGHFYRQALAVERIGNRCSPDAEVFRFEDYVADYAIGKCSDGSVAEAFIPDCLKELVAHDEGKGTRLTLLLREYLDNNCNIARTSRALYLHRSTFLYQLERTRELLGVDLDDADVRFGLQVALRIMKVGAAAGGAAAGVGSVAAARGWRAASRALQRDGAGCSTGVAARDAAPFDKV